MKIKATAEFSKLGSANNWGGFGKETFCKLESGESVDFNCPKDLIEDGFVEVVESQSKSKKDKK